MVSLENYSFMWLSMNPAYKSQIPREMDNSQGPCQVTLGLKMFEHAHLIWMAMRVLASLCACHKQNSRVPY